MTIYDISQIKIGLLFFVETGNMYFTFLYAAQHGSCHDNVVS